MAARGAMQGRTALVTGAGKGIGRAVAVALAREGAHVGLVARTRRDLEAVAAELAGLGVRAAVAPADLADRAAAEAAVAAVTAELGDVDVLVNNAGMAERGAVVDMDPEAWERTFRVNLFGSYYVTRAVLPAMIARRAGDVINVASTAGLSGAATMSAYSGSKAAMLRLTESLAAEVRKHDVRVTALLPSTVNTELSAAMGLPIGAEERMMQPDDVAELVVATLRLPRRVFVRDVAILTTNPQQ
jgi:3-oxoacyl-[acyl-carrier protein] reductase